jgi:reversibly glycosylated polypeptide/UDP-arabinopyranose mutase
VLSHGLWYGIPDLDAPTQLVSPSLKLTSVETRVMPRGTYFPMCGMNLAFTPALAPAMYFLLMGEGWPYDRFDDIWAGVLVKKVCDHLGLAVASGEPVVEHRRPPGNVARSLAPCGCPAGSAGQGAHEGGRWQGRLDAEGGSRF